MMVYILTEHDYRVNPFDVDDKDIRDVSVRGVYFSEEDGLLALQEMEAKDPENSYCTVMVLEEWDAAIQESGRYWQKSRELSRVEGQWIHGPWGLEEFTKDASWVRTIE